MSAERHPDCPCLNRDDRWELEACIDGRVYGPCTSDACGGVCEPMGPCGTDCPCHRSTA